MNVTWSFQASFDQPSAQLYSLFISKMMSHCNQIVLLIVCVRACVHSRVWASDLQQYTIISAQICEPPRVKAGLLLSTLISSAFMSACQPK